jgi:parvulin-like peptidyl-prolyl isomerase
MLCCGALLAAPVAGQTPATPPVAGVYAYVDRQPVLQRDVHAALSELLRKKFYHGQVPEGQMEATLKEAQDIVIDGLLLQREIERRAIEADLVKVEEEIEKYEARYKSSPQWQQQRASVLPGLRAELERRSRLERLEQSAKAMPPPDTAAVRAYYEANPQLFTEPERLRLRTILLAVDPASPATAWQQAREEAQRIVKRLRDGADFAETARIHSQDKSAVNGGDVGYLHVGMLPEAMQQRLDGFQVGVIADPIDVLEGVAIVRVEERIAARLRAFADVETRARELLEREIQNKAWDDFRAGLRRAAVIEVVEPMPLKPR